MRRTHLISFAVCILFSGVVFAQESQSVGDVTRKPDPEKAKTVESIPPASGASPQPGHDRVPGEGIESIDAAANGAQTEAEKYAANARELLSHEEFDQLDQMADEARRGKTRFAGGGWKLYTLYESIAVVPRKGTELTDEDWEAHLAKLKKWVLQKPDSITAQVALADGYVDYGWHARGHDYAEKVTEEGWRLFDERLNLARVTLELASTLKEKCPHWYLVAQNLLLSRHGDKVRAEAVLDQAIAFEPGYYYYYIGHSNYLLPQWYGEEGDIGKFADEIASRVGGGEGDFVYFQIATRHASGTKDQPSLKELSKMSWTRIMRGYSAMEQRYGTNMLRLNQFARLAIAFTDPSVAQRTFVRIGDRWAQRVWHTKKFFEDSRQWAKARTEHLQAISTQIDAMQSPEVRRYYEQVAKEFQERFAPAVRSCALQVDSNLPGFDIFLLIMPDGSIRTPDSSLGIMLDTCLVPHIKTATFSLPPFKSAYWTKISVNLQP